MVNKPFVSMFKLTIQRNKQSSGPLSVTRAAYTVGCCITGRQHLWPNELKKNFKSEFHTNIIQYD